MRFLLALALVLSQAPPVQQVAQEGTSQGNDSSTRKDPITSRAATQPRPIAQPHQPQTADLQWYGDVKITDGLIALFTLGLVVVGFFQWRALSDTVSEASKTASRQSADMQASIAVAREAANASMTAASAAAESVEAYRRSERAWVSHTEVRYNPWTGTYNGKPATGIMFVVRWVNGGRTPAIRCRMFTDHKVLMAPNSTDIPQFVVIPPDGGQRETPLIPNIPVSSPRIYLEQTVIQKLIEGQCRLFLYGRADYELVFPQTDAVKPSAEVCMEAEFGGYDSSTKLPSFTFMPTGRQNTST